MGTLLISNQYVKKDASSKRTVKYQEIELLCSPKTSLKLSLAKNDLHSLCLNHVIISLFIIMVSLYSSRWNSEPALGAYTKTKIKVKAKDNVFDEVRESIEEPRRASFRREGDDDVLRDSSSIKEERDSKEFPGVKERESGLKERVSRGPRKGLGSTQNRRVLLAPVFRILVLDVPLLFTLGIYCFLMWVDHVKENHLIPQLDAVEWTEERASQESTYYNRHCSELDLSTTNVEDLFLSDTATPQDAYDHQLRHGFTVFPNVLSEETATVLRNHIVSKNSELTDAEKNIVIEEKYRYSFNLGIDEPSVSKAAMEVTNNIHLKAAVEKIMGKNPSLIELTAITSTKNAAAQHWHNDVIGETSALQYARAFSPAYSMFIVLQNTTKSMGATSVCPGTHMCSGGKLNQVCDDHGFQLVGKEGYNRAGDALLMNMNR